jgi:lipopolysaccharide export LptBFGC system permease protein LptF
MFTYLKLSMFVSSTGQNGQVKLYKNTNFDKEDILTNHKSFMSSLNIPINEENCELSTLYWTPKSQKNQYVDSYIILLVQPYFLWFLNILMMFTYLKLSMFVSSTGQSGQVNNYHLGSVVCYP